MKESDRTAYIFLPGGLGTLDEFFVSGAALVTVVPARQRLASCPWRAAFFTIGPAKVRAQRRSPRQLALPLHLPPSSTSQEILTLVQLRKLGTKFPVPIILVRWQAAPDTCAGRGAQPPHATSPHCQCECTDSLPLPLVCQLAGGLRWLLRGPAAGAGRCAGPLSCKQAAQPAPAACGPHCNLRIGAMLHEHVCANVLLDVLLRPPPWIPRPQFMKACNDHGTVGAPELRDLVVAHDNEGVLDVLRQVGT